MDGARPLLEQVLEVDPDNKEALLHLFNVEKLNPDSEQFHKAASKLLHSFCEDKEYHEDMYKAYKEYRKNSTRSRLGIDLLLRISAVLCALGYPEDSEKILAAIQRSHPKLQQIPNCIVNLGQAYLRKGMEAKGQKCLLIISKKYPHSPEALVADRLLKSA